MVNDCIIYPLVSCYIANWKMAIEIVSFAIKHDDFSIISSYVKLPEGIHWLVVYLPLKYMSQVG